MDVQNYGLELTKDMIKPAPYNPRIITDDEFKGLKQSINSFGDISGITFNRRTGNLVTGHHRYKALEQKFPQMTFVHIGGEIYRIDNDGKPTGYDIRVVDWEEHKEIAANIAANSHTIAGSFDTESLSTLIAEVKINTPELYHAVNLPKLERDLGIYFDVNSGNAEVKHLVENDTFSKSTREYLDEFLQADSKTLRLVIESKDYEDFISGAKIIMQSNKIENMSDLFVFLVKEYNAKGSF
jgi:hypothetical protein